MEQGPNGQDLHDLLKETYLAFGRGDFEFAEVKASKAHSLDFESQEIKDALLCAMFWKERWKRLQETEGTVRQVDYLFTEYQGFRNRFISRLNSPLEEGLHAIRQSVLGHCLQLYQTILETDGPALGPLLNIAKCHKAMGEYDLAIRSLEQTNAHFKDEAEVLSEMADCYEMISETRLARVLFREAFYINPQKVDLTFLESTMVRKVLDSLQDRGYSMVLLKEWIPVQGVLMGVFNVKRELKPVELAQLKQSIHTLRNELQASRKENNPLLPRLINRYFWLIDHYQSVREDRLKIEEVLLNIKLLDLNVYNLYTN